MDLASVYIKRETTSISPHLNFNYLNMWSVVLIATSFLVKSSFSSAFIESPNATVLSRQRRFTLPDASQDWTFTVKFVLDLPIAGLDTTLSSTLPFAYTFKPGSLGRKKRHATMDFDLDERTAILSSIEKFMPTVLTLPPGAESHDCVLRALCEVARTPQNQDGLFGDFMNLLLTPHYLLDSPANSSSDFLDAQRLGHFTEDCSVYEKKCALSLFEVCSKQ